MRWLQRSSAAVGAVLLGLAVLSGQAVRGSEQPNSCELVRQALLASQHLKAGMTRAEVEKEFQEDGGMTFSSGTEHHDRYTYRTCGMIKIDVDLALTDESKPGPKDRVISVSRPYLEFESKD